MPTSPYSQLDIFVDLLFKLRPSSILDVGIGNGKIGFIARDFLDVMLNGAYRRDSWQVKIDGIEIFSDYIQDHQKAIYDSIYVGNAFEIIDGLQQYDLIILSDVLEHFAEADAWVMLDKCAAKTKDIILNIPLGKTWVQDDIYGNTYEKHLSFWDKKAFEPFFSVADYHNYAIGEYGCFLINANDYLVYMRTGETVKSQIIYETKRFVKQPGNHND